VRPGDPGDLLLDKPTPSVYCERDRARYPSGKGVVCENPFDSIVLTALSSVFFSKIAPQNPDSLLKSCSNVRCERTLPIRRGWTSFIKRAQFTDAPAAPLVLLAGAAGTQIVPLSVWEECPDCRGEDHAVPR
jgi:hypothetical protein